MKKTAQTEKDRHVFDAFFGELPSASREIVLFDDVSLEPIAATRETRILDAMLAAIKFVFLFAPGVFAVSSITLAFITLSFEYAIAVEIFVGSLGFLAAGTFMMMFGAGKLRDLRYLKMVGAVLLLAALESVLYLIFEITVSRDFFGAAMLAACLLNVFAGFVVKRHLDRVVIEA